MLSGVGEYPINDINAELTSAVVARNVLAEQSRLMQQKPWHFNTELGYALPADVEGKVPVPSNMIAFDWKRTNLADYTVRGGYVYDRKNQTFIISNGLASDITVLLEFADLPQPAKSYLLIRSTRVFQDRWLGDGALHQYQKEDEKDAWLELLQSDAAEADYNIFDNEHFSMMANRRL